MRESWRLIHNATKVEAKRGDPVVTFRGEPGVLTSWAPPHKPGSTGKVVIRFRGVAGGEAEFYPSVVDCTFVRVARPYAAITALPEGFTVERDSDGDWVLVPPEDVTIFSVPGEGYLLDAETEDEARSAAITYLRSIEEG